jgi:hypothetical protein
LTGCASSFAARCRERHDILIASARNSTIIDTEGRSFIDFAGGIGVMNVGHAHPGFWTPPGRNWTASRIPPLAFSATRPISGSPPDSMKRRPEHLPNARSSSIQVQRRGERRQGCPACHRPSGNRCLCQSFPRSHQSDHGLTSKISPTRRTSVHSRPTFTAFPTPTVIAARSIRPIRPAELNARICFEPRLRTSFKPTR